MKQLILLAILFATVAASAQQKDTVLSKSYLADSIIVLKGSIELEPIEVGSNGDTVRSMSLSLLDVTSDTTVAILSYVQLFDRNCNKLQDFNVMIPPTVARNWSARYAYIISQRKRLVWLQ